MVPLCYKTQSEDTSIEAELVQFGLWRSLSPAQKSALFRRVAKRVSTLILMGFRSQFPDASPAEIRQHYIIKRLGQQWVDILGFDNGGALRMEDPHLASVQTGNYFRSFRDSVLCWGFCGEFPARRSEIYGRFRCSS